MIYFLWSTSSDFFSFPSCDMRFVQITCQTVTWDLTCSISFIILNLWPILVTPSSAKSSFVNVAKCTPSISFSWKFKAYCPQPLSLSQSQTSTQLQVVTLECAFNVCFSWRNCFLAFIKYCLCQGPWKVWGRRVR